jgi:hypothetical protein
MKKKTVGIAGVDAHAFPVKAGPLTVEIFPYKVHFKTLRSYIVLEKPISRELALARRQLYDAIRDCRLFFANVRWGNADHFEFYAANGEQKVCCGGKINLHRTYLHIKLPQRAIVRLIHNGQCCLETMSDQLDYLVPAQGIYRVEAWKGKRGWIFSNHITINK